MGPWFHGGWSRRRRRRSLGDVSFNAKTAEFYREQIELPFFEYHLKGKGDVQAAQGLGVRDRHQRVAAVRRLAAAKHAAAGALLPCRRPARRSSRPATPAEAGFDEYLSDPAQPVPYHRQDRTSACAAEYMIADQRFAARRPDVLVYQTDVLDKDVTIAGPIEADLHVSTTGTDRTGSSS